MRRGRNQLAAWHADKPGEKGAGAGNNICKICEILI